jgi:hypothetical protein
MEECFASSFSDQSNNNSPIEKALKRVAAEFGTNVVPLTARTLRTTPFSEEAVEFIQGFAQVFPAFAEMLALSFPQAGVANDQKQQQQQEQDQEQEEQVSTPWTTSGTAAASVVAQAKVFSDAFDALLLQQNVPRNSQPKEAKTAPNSSKLQPDTPTPTKGGQGVFRGFPAPVTDAQGKQTLDLTNFDLDTLLSDGVARTFARSTTLNL